MFPDVYTHFIKYYNVILQIFAMKLGPLVLTAYITSEMPIANRYELDYQIFSTVIA